MFCVLCIKFACPKLMKISFYALRKLYSSRFYIYVYDTSQQFFCEWREVGVKVLFILYNRPSSISLEH